MYMYMNITEVLNQYLQFMNEYLSELESRAEQESSCVKESALQPTGWKVSNSAQKQWVKHNTEHRALWDPRAEWHSGGVAAVQPKRLSPVG